MEPQHSTDPQIEALLLRVAALEHALADTTERTRPPVPSLVTPGPARSRTRRDIFKLAGAAAVGTVGASVLAASPAAATNGVVATDPAQITKLDYTGTDSLKSAFVFQAGTKWAQATSAFPAAIAGWAANDVQRTGVYGFSDTEDSFGVVGYATKETSVGVHGKADDGGIGVKGVSTYDGDDFGHSELHVGVSGEAERAVGVHGASRHNVGVFGRSYSNSHFGVYGYNGNSNGGGVYGLGTETGVQGNLANPESHPNGVGVRGNAGSGTGVEGNATSGVGVKAKATEGVGLAASSDLGFAVDAVSGGAGAIRGSGGVYAIAAMTSARSNLYLQPDNGQPGNPIPKVAPLSRIDEHQVGELENVDGDLWWCVQAGSPGIWRKISGTSVAGGFHPVTPGRVYDSRQANPAPGALTAGDHRTVSVADRRDALTDSGDVVEVGFVPAGATAVTANVTITRTVGSGYLVCNPGGNETVGASTINWSSDNQDIANGITLTLNDQRELTIIAGGNGATHFLIDITGYYL